MKNKEKLITSDLKTLIKRYSKNDVISNIEKNYSKDNIKYISSDLIEDNRFLKNIKINQNDLKDVADSLKENGFYNPLIVRTIEGDKFEVILGRKRFLSTSLIGKMDIPVIVTKFNDEEVLLTLLADCRERRNVSAYETAVILDRLIHDYKYKSKDLALILDQSPSQVSNLICILNLPKYILDDLSYNKISYGHAKCIARLEPNLIDETYTKIIDEKMSVRELEDYVNSLKTTKKVENCSVFIENNKIIIKVNNEDLLEEVEKDIKNYINLKNK